jgi:Tol biopolymer transport system component
MDASFPAFSRDGRRLAFAQSTINANVWQVPLAAPGRSGGAPGKLISSSRQQTDAAVSPDGRRLAFGSTRTGAQEVWTSDVDGSNPQVLTAFHGPMTGSPQWSPDGRFIAFDSRAGGSASLYVAPSEGGPVRRVETGAIDSAEPTWSRDGTSLYFDAWVSALTQILKAPATGGQATQVTKGGGSRPRMSSDGTTIYYSRESGVWSVPAGGGSEQRVAGVPRLAPGFESAWAAGATGIYFIDPTSSRPDIEFVGFGGMPAVRVVDLPGPPMDWQSISVSPDGRRLLYSQIDGIRGDIMLADGLTSPGLQ